MRSIRCIMVLPLLTGCFYLVACDGTGAGTLSSFLSQMSGSSLDGRNNFEDSSVADVSADPGGDFIDSSTIYSDGASRARVRNESEYRADITLRFVRSDNIVHLAFIQVLPDMVTTVSSIKKVDSVELTGEDALGRALNGKTFFFGVDFDAFLPAIYVILPDGSVELITPQQVPESQSPTLQLLEPSTDITLTIGSSIRTRWIDDGWRAGTMVQIYLQREDTTSSAEWIPVGQPVGAALDGVNDERLVVLDHLSTGTYRVIARTNNTDRSITSIAPGRIHLIEDPSNIAPTLTILSPVNLIQRRNGDTLEVVWEDSDPDDPAAITFALESVASPGVGAGTFLLSPPIAEDPDGGLSDSASFIITGVLPGLYDLVGTIDDGMLMGTSRINGIVRILPEPENDPPQLEFLEPLIDIQVPVGGSFTVEWSDADENDNARISFLLDPDIGNVQLNGNEIVLVNSLDEDEDGIGDRIILDLPENIELRPYRLLGVIMDGQTEVVTSAPGRIIVIDRTEDNEDNSTGDGGGGDTDSDGDNSDGDGGEDSPTDITIIDVGDPNRITRTTTLQFLVQLTPVPPDLPDRAKISNASHGGHLEITLSADQWSLSEAGELSLNIPVDLVPNDAEPRDFDVITELTFDSELIISISVRPVYIP